MTVVLLVLMGVCGLVEWLWIVHAGHLVADGGGAVPGAVRPPAARTDTAAWALAAASCAAIGAPRPPTTLTASRSP